MEERRPTGIIPQVRRSVWSVAALLAIPVVVGLIVLIVYASRYQSMIRRMDAAAELKPLISESLPENLFAVTAGQVSFEDSGCEALIARVSDTLDQLLRETEGSGHLQLTVARRTVDTAAQYVHSVRDGMAAAKPVAEMEAIVDEVRDVGRLVTEMLDAFTTEEIAAATASSRRLSNIIGYTALGEVLLLAAAFWCTHRGASRLTFTISDALHSLEEAVRHIAEGHFQDRVTDIPVAELQELAESINRMANRLEALLQQTRQNQDHLAKAELRTLQAQINPHFLYNTLDTIVWQAESGKAEEVVRLTRSLSDFFRISLSSGADWIPVEQELKHVSAYLSIQQTRYRDILTYEVECPEGLGTVYMLKLLLQPLVENALYHGIKAKRGGGKILVRVQEQRGILHMSVQDTGKGMSPERLAETLAMLQDTSSAVLPTAEPGHSGFGLKNVDMRIRLYYRKQKGLTIHSGPEGTTVSFTIPVRTREEIDHDEGLSGG